MEAYVLRRAGFAVAGNQEGVHVLRSKGFLGPVEVIPQFGVDPNLYSPMPGNRRASGSDWFTIGYAGRLVEQKGVQLLLRSTAKLNGNWRLIVLGEGPYRPVLQELALTLGVAGRVEFAEPIPSRLMASHLNTLDVLVLPSVTRANWKEQFGRVLVESMACGTPVIGSSCGEIPNVIGAAGLVFPEGDADALAQALEQMQHNSALRAELADRGRQRVIDCFTQARVARATYSVYQQILRS
jgi:glycosyltransferase involved in cell wall biosynthesis